MNKITAQQMLNSLPTIQKMMNYNLPVKAAYSVFNLAKQINQQQEFFTQKERDLITQYEAEVLDSGNVRFKDPQSQFEFMKAHKELMDCEVEGIAPIELQFDDFKDATFTPAEIAALEGVIELK